MVQCFNVKQRSVASQHSKTKWYRQAFMWGMGQAPRWRRASAHCGLGSVTQHIVKLCSSPRDSIDNKLTSHCQIVLSLARKVRVRIIRRFLLQPHCGREEHCLRGVRQQCADHRHAGRDGRRRRGIDPRGPQQCYDPKLLAASRGFVKAPLPPPLSRRACRSIVVVQ